MVHPVITAICILMSLFWDMVYFTLLLSVVQWYKADQK